MVMLHSPDFSLFLYMYHSHQCFGMKRILLLGVICHPTLGAELPFPPYARNVVIYMA